MARNEVFSTDIYMGNTIKEKPCNALCSRALYCLQSERRECLPDANDEGGWSSRHSYLWNGWIWSQHDGPGIPFTAKRSWADCGPEEKRGVKESTTPPCTGTVGNEEAEKSAHHETFYHIPGWHTFHQFTFAKVEKGKPHKRSNGNGRKGSFEMAWLEIAFEPAAFLS